MEPLKIDNLFTDEEIKLIYDHLNNFGLTEFLDKEDTHKDLSYFLNVDDVGYCSFSNEWPKEILDKIKNKVKNTLLFEGNDLLMHFARYTKKTGYRPQLRPHFDKFLTKPSLTLSIQLKTTIPLWRIWVDEYNTIIPENSAILFSGTHQVHFRELKDFNDDDFCDILVCQIPLENISFPEKHDYIMLLKLDQSLKFYRSSFDETV